MPEILAQALPEGREFAIGIPVHGANRVGEGRFDIDRDFLGNGVGVLVHVELDANVLLRGAVRRVAAQVLPDGKVIERYRTARARRLRSHWPSLKGSIPSHPLPAISATGCIGCRRLLAVLRGNQ